MQGETITFNITSGPHAGLSGTGITDANGLAGWNYTGTSAGTDVIVASGAGVTSNEVTKTWSCLRMW